MRMRRIFIGRLKCSLKKYRRRRGTLGRGHEHMVWLNAKFSLMSVGCILKKNVEHNAAEKMINFLRARDKKL